MSNPDEKPLTDPIEKGKFKPNSPIFPLNFNHNL